MPNFIMTSAPVEKIYKEITVQWRKKKKRRNNKEELIWVASLGFEKPLLKNWPKLVKKRTTKFRSHEKVFRFGNQQKMDRMAVTYM